MSENTEGRWPPGTAVAKYNDHLLEVYEPYAAFEVRVRDLCGDWPGLLAIGPGMLTPLTPLARELLRVARRPR